VKGQNINRVSGEVEGTEFHASYGTAGYIHSRKRWETVALDNRQLHRLKTNIVILQYDQKKK